MSFLEVATQTRKNLKVEFLHIFPFKKGMSEFSKECSFKRAFLGSVCICRQNIFLVQFQAMEARAHA